MLRPSRVLLSIICVMPLLLVGCAGLRAMVPQRKVTCVLPPNPTVGQVIDHVNANVDKVSGYRASNVRIRANNLPGLSGNLVVEGDRRLHLQVSSLMGAEVDLGSNDQVFWIWARRNEPAGVYYAAHADMDVARQNLPIPFEPQWLMEALGVVPLSAEGVELGGEPGGPIKLVSQHQMPGGQQIRKVVVVDPCRGHVIEHSTYTAQGRPLVRALLQDYRLDSKTGVMLPRHIKLDWPQAEMSLAMDLGQVEVNPPAIASAVWEMPQVPGCPMVNLGQRRDPDIQIASGKARITDEGGPAVRPPREAKIAFGPATDEFQAPEIAGPTGDRPVVLDEPVFMEPATFEPAAMEPTLGPAEAALPTVRPF